ncbi:MAG: MopE-related protein [Bradymonadia bacterium]
MFRRPSHRRSSRTSAWGALCIATAALIGCGEDIEYNDYNLTLDMTACLGATPGGESAEEGPSCRAQLDQTVSDSAVNACMLLRNVEADKIDYIPLSWRKGADAQSPGRLAFADGANTAIELSVGAVVEAELYFFRQGVDGAPLCVKGGGLEMNGECTPDSPCLLKLKQPQTAIAGGEDGTQFDFGRRGGDGQCITEGSLMPAGDGAVAEICDGLDNDCDLQVDEGQLPQVGDNCPESIAEDGTTRQGICAPGNLICEAGALICRSETLPNDRELCGNGIDEDCDGNTDESDPRIFFTPPGTEDQLIMGEACQLGLGQCLTDGMVVCDEESSGAAVLCNAAPPPGAEEVCDALDNDCDGRMDEDLLYSDLDVNGQPLNRNVPLGRVCTQGLGECEAQGTVVCNPDGNGETMCNANVIEPIEEMCNNLDDDCDGQIDETFPLGQMCQIGNGECISRGVLVCTQDGAGTECNAVPILPGDNPELCGDNLDNDCDGIVDEYLNGRFEDFLGEECSVGTGACFAQGQVVCNADRTDVVCGAVAGEPAPNDQNCNGVDDDCDGVNDENYPEIAPEEDCGVGACAASARFICVAGEVVSACRNGEPAPNDAVCNSIDDDCNGAVDEDFPFTNTTCGVGECVSAGTQLCSGGRVIDTCVPGQPAVADATCDGRDDDCDGVTDEDFVTNITQCGVGACAAEGQTRCVNGRVEDTCTPAPPAPNDAVCDGVDSDCDARTDEHYLSQNTNCGVGQCAANGLTFCVNGQVQDSCLPGQPVGNDATCDGRDDDCDGTNDEAYVRLDTQCGIGECFRLGRTRCTNGSVVDSCTPAAPAQNDASCNGEDNDCDGLFDENFTSTPTECGVGECFSRGQTVCQGGVPLDTCAVGQPANDDAGCNDRDDDCDGEIDEDFVRFNTNCGIGACARQGFSQCVDGNIDPACFPGQPEDDDATCDGVDDDCDGLTDEDFEPVQVNCGQGACAATGFTTCVGGNAGDTCREDDPAADDTTCDGVDDDCDNRLDEDYVQTPTSCGLGICAAVGTLRCVNGSEQDTCQAGQAEGNDATCNNQDEDCDGRFDEDFIVTATSCGVGECAATGLRQCNNGVVQNTCAPGQPAANDNTCDLQDDDCDGLNDEDFQSQNTNCGVGDCARNGQTLCLNGQVQDSCTPGNPAPNDATCDGDDDDCDGLIDEDFVNTPTSCGVGECTRAGQLTCVNGQVQDTCTPGNPVGSDNNCNGEDNDCDGLIDERFGRNVNCGDGACADSGEEICVNGEVVNTCRVGDPAPDDATCDGVDDDCDGATDEDFNVINTNCGVGACAANGQRICSNGSIVDTCTPGQPAPDDATCDGDDDDCDGNTDENYDVTPTSCGVGECAATGQLVCIAGAETDNCNEGAPVAELCNGLDDDCDGSVDETFANLGNACTNGFGACEQAGAFVCNGDGSGTECNAIPGAPEAEICDGVDNDCDDSVDENNPGGGGGCTANNADGICRNGTSLCQGGVLICAPGTPEVEECNALDDDCDGEIDNVAGAGNNCTTGFNNQCAGKLECVGVNLRCVPTNPSAIDYCGDGIDNDCDSTADDGEGQPCTPEAGAPCAEGVNVCNDQGDADVTNNVLECQCP